MPTNFHESVQNWLTYSQNPRGTTHPNYLIFTKNLMHLTHCALSVYILQSASIPNPSQNLCFKLLTSLTSDVIDENKTKDVVVKLRSKQNRATEIRHRVSKKGTPCRIRNRNKRSRSNPVAVSGLVQLGWSSGQQGAPPVATGIEAIGATQWTYGSARDYYVEHNCRSR